MNNAPPHVLVVDDEEDFCELMALRLEHHGFRVTTRQTVQGGLEVLDRQHVDALVLDVRLHDESGLALLDEVKRRGLRLPTVVLTAEGSAGFPQLAGVATVMLKPFDTRELLRWVTRAVQPLTHGRAAAHAPHPPRGQPCTSDALP